MKRLAFLLIPVLAFGGCASKESAPPGDGTAGKFTQWASLSETSQTGVAQTGVLAWTWTKGLNPLSESAFSGVAIKTFPIPKKEEENARTILLTPLSECSDPKYLSEIRTFFSKMDAPEAVKKRTDESIVNRCKIRAILRETGKCEKLSWEVLKDCGKLKSAIGLLNSKKDENDPNYLSAKAIYQAYFIDLEKFPPKDFIKSTEAEKAK